MKTVEEIAEVEMAAVYLKTEIDSARWSAIILSVLEKNNFERRIIERPNLADEVENQKRAVILGEFRGYQRNKEIFAGFPDDVRWQRARLSRGELERIKYINWDYWLEISGNTRLATEAAKRIRLNLVDAEEAKGFWAVSESLRRGATFPELILVGKSAGDDLVLLEGHVRLTGYLLEPQFLPQELTAIVGYSDKMSEWELY